MKTKKDQARSLGDKLSKIARECSVPYARVLTEFLLERLAVRLMGSPDLANRLVFKGGYVSLRIYDSPRYTIDLDALLRRGSLESVVATASAAAEADASDGVWFKLEKTVDLETQGEYGGLRLVFRTGLGERLSDLRKAQIVNLDIGKGDPVVPEPVDAETPFLLGDGTLSWRVYPIETIVAEKLHTLIVRGSASSRSKDIFDLNLFLDRCEPAVLKQALSETFRRRGDVVPKNVPDHISNVDRALLRLGWKSAIADLTPPPDFDAVFDKLLEKLKKAFL